MCFAPWTKIFRQNPSEIERFEVSLSARWKWGSGTFNLFFRNFTVFAHKPTIENMAGVNGYICSKESVGPWIFREVLTGEMRAVCAESETSKRSISLGFCRKILVQGAKHIYISVTFQIWHFCWPPGNICWLNWGQNTDENVKKDVFGAYVRPLKSF